MIYTLKIIFYLDRFLMAGIKLCALILLTCSIRTIWIIHCSIKRILLKLPEWLKRSICNFSLKIFQIFTRCTNKSFSYLVYYKVSLTTCILITLTRILYFIRFYVEFRLRIRNCQSNKKLFILFLHLILSLTSETTSKKKKKEGPQRKTNFNKTRMYVLFNTLLINSQTF